MIPAGLSGRGYMSKSLWGRPVLRPVRQQPGGRIAGVIRDDAGPDKPLEGIGNPVAGEGVDTRCRFDPCAG